MVSPIRLQKAQCREHLLSSARHVQRIFRLGPDGFGMKAWIHMENLEKEEQMVTIILLGFRV